jgi:hypothetical protein
MGHRQPLAANGGLRENLTIDEAPSTHAEYNDPPMCHRLMTQQPPWQRRMTPSDANPELDDRCAKIHRVGRGS